MTTLKFVDTHNMVTFLSRPTESDGFEQIVDFLNAHPIRHALTIYPTIYISCIEHFWSTFKVKTINGEAQLHALVDGKKIIITEAFVRRDLQLADEEGVECLPNSTIFEQLTLMGPKTTAWNEFSSTMASTIICLATNQKFNFSKFIFESMIRNLDNLSGKILMYPRVVQVFLDQQLDGMSTHKRIYIAPSHTKKIFGNMRRVGKGFSGRVTPLFQTMVVQNQSQLGEGSTIPTDPHHTPTFIQPSTQPQKTQKPRNPKRKDTQVPHPSDPTKSVVDEAVYKELGDSLVRATTTASSLEAEQDSGNINKTQSKATPNESSSLGTTSGGGPRCQETMGDTIAQTRVLDLEKTNTTQQNEIASLKRRVKKLEKKSRSRTHKLKRLYKVGLTARVESFDNEESLGEDASKQGRINVIDADEEITLVSIQNVDEEMFDVNVLDGEEVFVAEQEVAANEKDDDGEITLGQALIEMKSTKLKVKGVVIQEPGESTTIKSTPTISSQQSQDKEDMVRTYLVQGSLCYKKESLEIDPYNHSTPTSTKLLILDTGKFKQWKFRIQQYLQHEYYALWEVIEFGDSYKAPLEETGKGVTGEGSAKKKGRIVAITAEDMQKRKYDTAKELWEAILKTFGGNEATKKTKKNQLKQQHGNFKAEGSETLEQTFNRLQVIVSHLKFMDVPIKQDDLNQKFLTSLAPEWLVYTIVWRNRDDLDTMSLDDMYNHLKVYEPEVQK
ncbi:hypothetical protein Tco_1157652, partial [Tanacetum coccineum]